MTGFYMMETLAFNELRINYFDEVTQIKVRRGNGFPMLFIEKETPMHIYCYCYICINCSDLNDRLRILYGSFDWTKNLSTSILFFERHFMLFFLEKEKKKRDVKNDGKKGIFQILK